MVVRMWMKRIVVALIAVGLVAPVGAQVLAPVPPMGWNSWDSYGLTVTEAQFRANADVVAAKLKAFGWQYVVVDEGWYLQNPESAAKPETLVYTVDAQGQYSPALNRFPSAANGVGFKPLSDAMHAKGLKFGIHVIRGIPKKTVAADTVIAGSTFHASEAADAADVCPWNPDNFGVKDNAAGQAWYDALMKQYAGWGVDYLKVDCIASHPYKAAEIRMIHRAIAKTGRAIVLSLSPGPTALANAVEVGENAQLWRISDDVWDGWTGKEATFPQSLKGQFPVIASWSKYVRPGNWPDADMLPLGHLGPVPGYGEDRDTKLTQDEQRTMVTLWAISRSPLFLGANLTRLDALTRSLVTNAEVIGVDQHSVENHLAGQDGDVVAWTARSSSGSSDVRYLALFNLGDATVKVGSSFVKYGLGEKYKVRDLWEKENVGTQTGVSVELPAHGAALFELRP